MVIKEKDLWEWSKDRTVHIRRSGVETQRRRSFERDSKRTD